MNYVILAILGAATLAFAFLSWKLWQQVAGLRNRYAGIIDVHAELATAQQKLEQAKRAQKNLEHKSQQRRTELIQECKPLEAKRDELKKEISLLEENLEDISFGLYKPHFSFQTSEEYKAALENLRDRERQLIRDGKAAVCHTQWTVGNSAKEGQRMTRQYTKLMLRGFNGSPSTHSTSWEAPCRCR